ncbi:M12 family metallopeptidase, partial [Dyadobacter sp.]|uniref:M12 family metallopeptidase n=1 Tax=Dyadobacter sp. TaxID=1914288 RepID=UPI003F6FB939
MKNMLFFARISFFILSLVYLSACSGLKEEKALVPTIEKTSEQVAPELAYPGETGGEKEGTLFGKTIKYAEINGEAVFEGDIILSKKQLDAAAGARTEATGVSLNAQKWEKGIVYFTIEKTVTNTSAIYAAMAIIEASTPITFVYRSNQYNYVTFKFGRGFSSSIGVTGGQQFITLGLGFSKGGVLHEICHTLGLFHEHTRDDRDQTITVNFQNIAPALQANFLTHKQSGSAGFGFDKMDLKSVMMMNSDYCSNNGQPSMTTKDGQPFTVQRTELSPNDIRCLTAMYSNIYSVSDDGLYASDTRK